MCCSSAGIAMHKTAEKIMQSSVVGKASEEEEIGRMCFSKTIPLEYLEEESLTAAAKEIPSLFSALLPSRCS